MFHNAFRLLLNATNILMHASLGITTEYISCAVFEAHRKIEDTHKMWHAAYCSNSRLATPQLERGSL